MTYRAWELKNLDRAALLRFTGFCHINAPIIKRKRTLRPTFSKIIIEQYDYTTSPRKKQAPTGQNYLSAGFFSAHFLRSLRKRPVNSVLD